MSTIFHGCGWYLTNMRLLTIEAYLDRLELRRTFMLFAEEAITLTAG